MEKIVGRGISFSSLNFIVSDGEKLYALRYTDKRLSYYTLYYLERPRTAFNLRKLSKETRQLILIKLASREKATLTASEPISNKPHWKPIPNKHLIVIDPSLKLNLISLNNIHI